MSVRVHVLGGFLGAGKTTAMRAAARVLRERGERVAIVTNDQGYSLVDTATCVADAVGDERVLEIGGGCFCCRYPALEEALSAASASGATVVLAEAVGSCTDLIATVLAPLADRAAGTYRLAPLSVVVDPLRVVQVHRGELPDDVAYLFAKQVQEADLVVLSRADAVMPDVTDILKELGARAPVFRISGTTGQGVADWLDAEPAARAVPLDIDYERYARAEALLGWANARVTVIGELSPRAVITDFFDAMRDEPVAHLKLRVVEPASGTANQVRVGEPPTLDLEALPERAAGLQLVLNARVAVPPERLRDRLEAAMARAAGTATVRWEDFACFEPGRPVPVHRYATRCDPDADAACCAAFYQRPDIHYLLGDSYHPGGEALTLELAAALALPARGRLLDVACGLGTSLKAITAAHDVDGVGLDFGAAGLPDTATVSFVPGDAHQVPMDDESVDGVLCECALSTFADQPLALSEMYRVARPGAVVAISDMVANGALPPDVLDWIHIGTCLAHARTLPDYASLVESAGFEVVHTEDTPWALGKLLSGIKRRLLAAALARASGVLEVDIDIPRARRILRQARELLDAGTVSYGYIIARKPIPAT